MIESIRRGNYNRYCECINRHFDILKRISPLVSNRKIDKLVLDCLNSIADAVSICGAGGGGYLFAVLKEGKTIEDVQTFLSEKYLHITSKAKKIQILDKI